MVRRPPRTPRTDKLLPYTAIFRAKPFEMGELIARVRGVLRRAAGRGSNVVTAGRLRVDTQRMTVDLNGVPVRLSPLEFRLLDYLVHQGDRAVPAHEIADHLYGAADNSDSNAIEALVARLRRKVGADVIVTRRDRKRTRLNSSN